MKTIITLFSNLATSKKALQLFALAITLFAFTNQKANAATSISQFPNPNVCGGTYPTTYTTGSFSITETSIGTRRGFGPNQANRTLILGFSSANLQFNPGVGTVTVNSTGVTINSYAITATTITVNITTSATNVVANTISFNNFQVRATAAVTGATLRRTGGTFRIDNSANTPGNNTSWGNFTYAAPFAFSSATTTQSSTASVVPSSVNQRIIRVALVIAGGCSSVTATSFAFNTTGSTAPLTDIANAKLYYTGTSRRFSTTNLFGTTVAPNGVFNVTGSRALTAAGTYYFWLTYDLNPLATNANVVDAQATGVTLSGITSTFTGNPSGSRPIVATTYYSISAGNGNWNSNGNWSTVSNVGTSCTCTPTAGSIVVVAHSKLVNLNRSITNLSIINGGTLGYTSGTLTVTNLLTTAGNGKFTGLSNAVLNDVILVGTGASTMGASNSIAGDLDIGTGTSLTLTTSPVASGNVVSGNVGIVGTLAVGSNTFTWDGADAFITGTGSITGTGTIALTNDKTIESVTSLTVAPIIALSANTSVLNQGTISTTSNITGANATSSIWTNDVNSSLTMGGTTSALLATGTLDASANPNTITYSGSGAQTIKTSTAYHNLILNNATKTLNSATIINNDLTISGAAVLDASASNYNIDIYGNWINNSSATNPFIYRTAAVNFNGNTTISGTAISAFNTVNITSTGILVAHATAGKFTISGDFANDGVFTHNNGDVTFVTSGTPGGSNSTTISGSALTNFNTMTINSSKTLTLPASELDIDGNLTNNGTLIHNNGHVDFTGLGTTQTFGGTTTSNTLYKFELENAGGSLVLNNPLTVNDTLVLTNGLITTPSTSITIGVSGNTSGANSSAYVSGTIKRVFSAPASLLFPIGKGGNFRPLTFTYTALTGTSTVTVDQTESALTGTLPSLSVLNNTRTWDISQTGGSAFAYAVTLDGTGDVISGVPVILKKESGSITATTSGLPNYTNSADFTSLTGTCNFATGSNCSVSSNAGVDQTSASTCGLTSLLLNATVPSAGVGTWTVDTGVGGSFGNNTSETSSFSGTAGNVYSLQWTVTDGNCTAATNINVTLNRYPTTANAGTPFSICSGTSGALAANNPSVGTGLWSVFSGPNGNASQFSNTSAFNSTFTPTTNGTYVLRWTITSNPCGTSFSQVTITVGATIIPSVIIGASNNPACLGSAVTFTATPTNGGTSPTYQWKKGGVNIGGATSSTYVGVAGSDFLNGNVITCTITSNSVCASPTTATSTGITMSINANVTPSVTIATGSNPACSASSVTFTATPVNGGTTPTYDFRINGVTMQNTSSSTFTTSVLANADVVNCIMTSNATCPSPTTGTSNNVTMTVTSAPVVTSSSSSASICIGSSVNLTSSATTTNVLLINENFNAPGSWTTTNTSAGGTPAAAAWKQVSSTFLAGSGGYSANITSNDNSQFYISDSRIQGGGTTSTNTTLVSPVMNTIGYATLTLDFYHFYDFGAASGESAKVEVSTNGSSWTTLTTYTTTQGTASSFAHPSINLNSYVGNSTLFVRFIYVANARAHFWSIDNVTVTGSVNHTYAWAANPAGFTSTSQNPTGVAPTVTTAYTVTATNGLGCSTAATPVSVTVNSFVTPSVAIAITTGTNPACDNTTVNFTATPTNGGVTPTYQWTKNGTNILGAISATFSSLSGVDYVTNDVIRCVMTSNASCPSPSSATSSGITMTVSSTLSPSVSIAITSGSQSMCGGASVTFTATPTNGGSTPSYNFKVNGNSVQNGASATFTSTTLANSDAVTCVLTSSSLCPATPTATSNSIAVTITSNTPSVVISNNSTSVCTGISFTATPTNGGTSPTYQWQNNTVNISGATSSTYTGVALASGDIITCILTSNVSCPTSGTAVSNSIAVTFVAPTTNWTGASSASWTSAANWSAGVPTRDLAANIVSGTTFSPNITVTAEMYDLTITAGATLTVSGNTAIDIYGTFTNNGTFAGVTSTVNLKGCAGTTAANHSITTSNASTLTLANLTLNDVAGATLNTNASITDNLRLTNGTFTNNNKVFTFLSTATKTARIATVTGGSYTGNITMQRLAPGGTTGWAWIGSCINDAVLDDWYNNNTEIPMSGFSGVSYATGGSGNFVSVYTYDETAAGASNSSASYVAPSDVNDAIVPGLGYWVYLGNGYTTTTDMLFDVTGTPNIGNFTFPVTYTNTGSSVDDGWNLIANPYPSSINWMASTGWTKTNIGTTFYVYNADINNYTTFTSSALDSTNGGSRYIPSSQAFMIKASAASPLLSCTETVKSQQQPTFKSLTSNPVAGIRMKITKSGSMLTDESVVRFDANATNLFDENYDAEKQYPAFGAAVNICTVNDNKHLTYNILNSFDNSFQLPVVVKVPGNGIYNIHISNIEQLMIDYSQYFGTDNLVIEDVATGNITPLNGTMDYSMPVFNNDSTINLVVRFSNAVVTKIDKVALFNTVSIKAIGGKYYAAFDLKESNIANIELYNIAGQIVKPTIFANVSSNNILIDTNNLQSGVYFIKVVVGDKIVTRKVFLD